MHVVLHQMLMFWLVRKMAASTDMIYEIQGKPRHLVVVLGMHVTATAAAILNYFCNGVLLFCYSKTVKVSFSIFCFLVRPLVL
jgi:hypothetical protein